MTTAKDSKLNAAVPPFRQTQKPQTPPETPKRSAGLSPTAAFLVGAAVGAAIESPKPQGNQAHVHLSLGDDDKGCANTDYGQDFGL
jgi:hypothetical protein